MKSRHFLQGLITTIVVSAGLFWAIGMATNNDPQWWLRHFPGNAQAIILHWDGDNITLTPEQQGYAEIMQAVSTGIGKHSGYEGSVVFSETSITQYMQEWRLLEVRYTKPAQIHSRYNITKARTFLIPLNYTHANYRRVFALPDYATYCISAVNMSPENMEALINSVTTIAENNAVVRDETAVTLTEAIDPMFDTLPVADVMVIEDRFGGYYVPLQSMAAGWELGLYADDPYGNLGRLQYEAHRAARLVVDTGIHAYQSIH